MTMHARSSENLCNSAITIARVSSHNAAETVCHGHAIGRKEELGKGRRGKSTQVHTGTSFFPQLQLHMYVTVYHIGCLCRRNVQRAINWH